MSYFSLAALEITLLGLLSGIAGTLIVVRRRSFFAVALSHATFPGGVIFAVADKFQIPIRYIGVGEGIDDLRPFVANDFIEALFSRDE